MAVAQVLARLRSEPFADLPITQEIDQLCRRCQHVWRDRVLSPMLTIRLFVLQVLHGNTAITHLRHLSGLDFSPGSYADARKRLPLSVLASLLRSVIRRAQQISCQQTLTHSQQRVLVVDGSGFSMSDTPPLRRWFGLSGATKVGVGFPLGRILGLLDLASGMFLTVCATPLVINDMWCVSRVHGMLRSGDIVLGDRAFCSWTYFSLLNLHGVYGCFRVHPGRKIGLGCGLGRGHGRQRWPRPHHTPPWMTRRQFTALPEWLEVRLFTYRIEHKGYRTKTVMVATTLLDESLWPGEKLAELYGQRWRIETCFNHLKTTMKMNVLKCQSVEGVLKELAVYLLVYNLVCLAMLKAAQRQSVAVNRISFIDALRWLACRMLGLEAVDRLMINRCRPGRREPRAQRRRMKAYHLLNCPRAQWQEEWKTGHTSNERA